MDVSQALGFESMEAVDPVEDLGTTALTALERVRFDAAYREHRDAVMRLLHWRLGHSEDIADLTQEAYLRILRYRNCEPDSLKLLLFRTALNLAISHGIRARSRSTHVPLEDVEIAFDAPPMDEALYRDQRMQQLMTVVTSLPARCRQVFLLRLVHGLRQREIAERCGISTRRVEQHLARAQAVIREQVGVAA